MRIRPLPWLTALLVATAATGAQWEVGPTLGLMSGGQFEATGADGSADFDTSPTFGISASYRSRPDGWIELGWSRQASGFTAEQLSPRGGAYDLYIDRLQVGGIYRPPSEGVEPFVGFSAGVVRIDPRVPDAGTDLALTLAVSGGGAIPLAEDWWLRVRGRGWFVLGSASFTGVCGGIGCSFRLTGSGAFQLEALAEVTVRFGKPSPRPRR